MYISVKGHSVHIGSEVVNWSWSEIQVHQGTVLWEHSWGTVQLEVPGSPRIAGSQAVEGNKSQTENTGNRKKNFLLRCLSTALYCLCLTRVEN